MYRLTHTQYTQKRTPSDQGGAIPIFPCWVGQPPLSSLIPTKLRMYTRTHSCRRLFPHSTRHAPVFCKRAPKRMKRSRCRFFIYYCARNSPSLCGVPCNSCVDARPCAKLNISRHPKGYSHIQITNQTHSIPPMTQTPIPPPSSKSSSYRGLRRCDFSRPWLLPPFPAAPAQGRAAAGSHGRGAVGEHPHGRLPPRVVLGVCVEVRLEVAPAECLCVVVWVGVG